MSEPRTALRPRKHVAATYIGNPCKRGHSGLRYLTGRNCVVCNNERSSAAYKDNPALFRQRSHKWQKLPTPTRPEPTVCECCGESTGKRALALDHCHVSGVFRGWVCGSCNRGIGLLGDDIQGVTNALNYLKRTAQ